MSLTKLKNDQDAHQELMKDYRNLFFYHFLLSVIQMIILTELIYSYPLQLSSITSLRRLC
jgi:hypothetical protein